MKIVVTLDIDVDPELWDPWAGPKELRKDVKAYVHNAVRYSAEMVNVDAEVTVR